MTTIYLARAGRRSRQHQVFGQYEGQDDRYTFGLRTFDNYTDAEQAARAMIEKHGADHFARTNND